MTTSADKKVRGGNTLAQRASGTLSKKKSILTVGVLEQALLKKYPVQDAQDWDRSGIVVGDPSCTITGVTVALDATIEAIRETKALGKNVLVTHHPLFLNAPDSFRPAPSSALVNGAGVWAAIECGVAVMSFHTTLDVSADAARVLPGMLNLQFEGILDPLEGSKRKGFGQICSIRAADAPLTLEQLGARCTAVFGRPPRVWGDFPSEVSKVVTCTGSAGNLVDLCVKGGIECLICGEIRYHDALAASEAGLCIIELGHDVSELPLVAVLAAAVESAGVEKHSVALLDQERLWAHPESTRV